MDTQIQEDDDREDSRRLSLLGNRPPAEIDGYTLIRRLGTGAYGTVWLAREDHTGRVVAIKYYPHRRGLNWSLLSREVEKLATLYTSRNIVRLLDVGWNAEPPYYVMEYVENGSLGDLLDRGPMDVHEAVRIAREVCLALIEAHGAGVLHCDLKPDNVLLDSQYQVRLCDFGQSRMSHERSPALGTLYYMAPEQADLDAVADARWDVYAVGALLYHMLTGEPPYRTPELQRRLECADSLAERLEAYRAALRNAPPAAETPAGKGCRRSPCRDDRFLPGGRPGRTTAERSGHPGGTGARERNRARRPLLLLGLLGPVLLIAAMVPIFLNALQNNLNRMEVGLTDRALAHDAMSARIQAKALQRELADRVEELERVIQRDEFREALEVLSRKPPEELVALTATFHDPSRENRRPLSERPAWMRLLDTAHQNAAESNKALERSEDTSWFLQDATGTQIWRLPFNPRSVGQNYSWRDYFHGRGFEYSRDSVPEDVVPIRSSWVSIPFKSEATGRYMVAMATPVRSRENQVIGVFARTIHLGDLQSRLGQTLRRIRIRSGPLHHRTRRPADRTIARPSLADGRTPASEPEESRRPVPRAPDQQACRTDTGILRRPGWPAGYPIRSRLSRRMDGGHGSNGKSADAVAGDRPGKAGRRTAARRRHDPQRQADCLGRRRHQSDADGNRLAVCVASVQKSGTSRLPTRR